MGGVGLADHQLFEEQKSETRQGDGPKPPAKAAAPLALAEDKPTRTTPLGDPLPAGALARMGASRWRHGNRVCSVAFSPDGLTLASASDDATADIWDFATGRRVAAIEAGQSDIDAVAFSSDGKTLFSKGGKEIFLWELATGKRLRRFQGTSKPWSSLSPWPLVGRPSRRRALTRRFVSGRFRPAKN